MSAAFGIKKSIIKESKNPKIGVPTGIPGKLIVPEPTGTIQKVLKLPAPHAPNAPAADPKNQPQKK